MMPPDASRLPISDKWTIRPLADGDRAPLLRLNAGNSPEVWPLQEKELTDLLAFEGNHLVAVEAMGNVLGYLLSFPRASRYDDAEIKQFRRLLTEPFVYICQVVIATEHRRHGIGRALYDVITDESQRAGVRVLCCDVNTNPPNPGSLSFHRKLGFVQMGEGYASNGFGIAFLVKKW